jgi:glyoxylase-like metal-dependent hydrolase (beta-lactamase superfamily II)
VQGTLDALNKIIELAIPRDHEEGGTFIIPGHGRLCDEADVVEYRDMATIVRDRVLALSRRGQTAAQVKLARPSLDYDGRYGVSDAFIDAIFRP